MARVGDQMSNPVTRERFTWLQTAHSSGGAVAQFELQLQPGAAVPAPHVHPHQSERFTVRSGMVKMRVGTEERIVGAGEEQLIPAGIPHAWWHTGSDPADLIVELQPALRIEDYFETFCGLANDGKAAGNGLPRNPFQLGVLFWGHRAEFALPTRPQRVLLTPLIAALAMLGRRLGFRERYPRYSSD